MSDPVCVICTKPIPPIAHKVKVNGGAYHGRCWDLKEKAHLVATAAETPA
jgi:hypothetical protein